MPAEALEVRKLRKSFEPGKPDQTMVLDGVNLSLTRGELVTIIGSNGAGKTTLFNVIAGTLTPDRGRVILDGEDITWRKEYLRARDIGRLFQDPHQGTAPDLTIEENLALVYSKATRRFPLALALHKKERAFFIETLAKLDMGLETRLKVPVGTLSGGQRQALTLLLATLVPPKLLLLDEHTAALDPVAAKKILALTVEISASHGITTLMITHNILSALETGSRTIMMHKGRIVMDLRGEERGGMTVEDLLERYRERVKETLDADRLIFG
jgi:putative ABC transport system ATP-binding protein